MTPHRRGGFVVATTPRGTYGGLPQPFREAAIGGYSSWRSLRLRPRHRASDTGHGTRDETRKLATAVRALPSPLSLLGGKCQSRPPAAPRETRPRRIRRGYEKASANPHFQRARKRCAPRQLPHVPKRGIKGRGGVGTTKRPLAGGGGGGGSRKLNSHYEASKVRTI